jgi:hypothetical protein
MFNLFAVPAQKAGQIIISKNGSYFSILSIRFFVGLLLDHAMRVFMKQPPSTSSPTVTEHLKHGLTYFNIS